MRIAKLIITGLILALACVTIWALNLREQLNSYYSPFFDYEWESSRNLMLTKWKSNGRVHTYAYDLNEDLADDSLVMPGDVGSSASIWVDEDHNGRYEVEYSLDRTGRLYARYEDIGQDGTIEEFVHYTTDSLYAYKDFNGDGRFADGELRSKEPIR